MNAQQNLTLISRQSGDLAFGLRHYENENPFGHIQRLNYYTCIWIEEGEGSCKADFSTWHFSANKMFFFSPYQPFIFIRRKKNYPYNAYYFIQIFFA